MPKYPMASNFLFYKRINSWQYRVTDWLTDKQYIIGTNVVSLIRSLDGKTNPYKVKCNMKKSDIDNALRTMNRFGLLRHSMILEKSFGTIYRTMLIPKLTRNKRPVCFICNMLLMILFLPIFITGLFLVRNIVPETTYTTLIIGMLIYGIIGAFIHELAHAVACIAYGGRVFEIGIMVEKLKCGAYTLTDTDKIKHKRHLAQVYAAGIEANLFLAGMHFIIFSWLPSFGVLYYIGLWNAIVALTNFMFFNGVDGLNIISSALGVDNLRNKAKLVIRCPAIRKGLKKEGISGMVMVVGSYLIYYQPFVLIFFSLLLYILYILFL